MARVLRVRGSDDADSAGEIQMTAVEWRREMRGYQTLLAISREGRGGEERREGVVFRTVGYSSVLAP